MDLAEELAMLRKEKEEIERKIRRLMTLSVIHDNVKLDTIGTKGPQYGKWALSYKYKHIRWHGDTRTNEPGEKWVALYCCETRGEAIQNIPIVINELWDLYNELNLEKGE